MNSFTMQFMWNFELTSCETTHKQKATNSLNLFFVNIMPYPVLGVLQFHMSSEESGLLRQLETRALKAEPNTRLVTLQTLVTGIWIIVVAPQRTCTLKLLTWKTTHGLLLVPSQRGLSEQVLICNMLHNQSYRSLLIRIVESNIYTVTRCLCGACAKVCSVLI